GSTKSSGDCVVETLKEPIPEISVFPSVGTFVAPATATNIGTSGIPAFVTSEIVHDNATEKEGISVIEKSGNNLVDYPDSNESSKSQAG
ncbi:hypothetical protein A2U01_0082015, partial [Trifolium medium]|nr:hypothetical protein [Trifolium medium]